MINIKKYFIIAGLVFILSMSVYLLVILKDLPLTYTLDKYQPPLISFVYDKNGETIGEFFKQRRLLVPFEKFPKHLLQAFVAAEDSQFYEHSGLNYKSIFRALLVNIRAGRKVQGGSTITQQVARSLLLSLKKTYTRKIKEALLASRMEESLSKEDILYLYLNQIYFGHGAYGVGMAAKIYFKKEVHELALEESAMLAGLPQAPSRFSPIINSKKAKKRQIYVLHRMFTEGYISEERYKESKSQPLTVFVRENYSNKAPFVIETIRQLLVESIGEKTLLNKGLQIHTSIDYKLQVEAQKSLKRGLKELDKRQGYRGVIKNISENEWSTFLAKAEKKWIDKQKDYRIIDMNGVDSVDSSQFSHLNPVSQTQGIVTSVEQGLTYVSLIFGNTGIIPIQTTKWARPPNEKTSSRSLTLKSMADILRVGDVIWVQVENPKANRSNRKLALSLEEQLQDRLLLSLEQEPVVQGALLSLDQETEDILAMVGGYSFTKSQFNRVYQSKRQTGSAFKPFIYASALDKGFTPSSVISDEPVVFANEEADLLLKERAEELKISTDLADQTPEIKKEKKGSWRPSNYSKHFTGDILFRNALIRSLNVPTVKLVESIGIPWIEFYVRRLGIVSKLNFDYTLALGSSSISLYEMTKAFSIFGRQGRQIVPILVKAVTDHDGEVIISDVSLDNKFKDSLHAFKEEFEKSWIDYWNSKEEELLNQRMMELTAPINEEGMLEELVEKPKEKEKPSSIFFEDLNQIISPESAYLITSVLKGAIFESGGTGARARYLKRPLAGKTGSTDGYYDAWFIGYSPQIATGVWVGFDNEKTLGPSETGSKAALPIWVNFMEASHKELDAIEFKVPKSVIFANIDNKTGYLAGASTKDAVRQAFVEGTEPKKQKEEVQEDLDDDQNFLRKDLSF